MNNLFPVYAADGANISSLPNPATNIPLATNIAGLLTLSNGVNLLNLIFILTGLFFFTNLILAGWEFMMSSGDTKKISAASTRITNGLIGLVMTFTAFIVVRIITNMLGLGTLV